MFYALTKKHQLIHIQQALHSEQYFCPECHQPLIIKKGIKTKKHFSHKKGQHCSHHDGESLQHQQAKEQLAQKLSNQFKVKKEYRIYQGNRLRIADICLVDKQYIIEFQQSIISYQLLSDRHHFYLQKGYKVLWLLNDNLITVKYKKIKLTRFLRSFINYTSSYFYIITYHPKYQKCFVYYLYVNGLFEQYVGYHKMAIDIQQLINNEVMLYQSPGNIEISKQSKVNFIQHMIKYNRSIYHQLLTDLYQLK